MAQAAARERHAELLKQGPPQPPTLPMPIMGARPPWGGPPGGMPPPNAFPPRGFPGQGFPRVSCVLCFCDFRGLMTQQPRETYYRIARLDAIKPANVVHAGLAGSRRTFPPKICLGRQVRRRFLRDRAFLRKAGSQVLLTGSPLRRRRRRSRAGSGRGRASGPAGGDGGGLITRQLLTSSAAGPRNSLSPGRDCMPWRKGTGRNRAPIERRSLASPASLA